MLNHTVNQWSLVPEATTLSVNLSEPLCTWKSYKLANRNLDFTFIPAPFSPECPTSVGLSLRPAYSVVTLYCPEPEDIFSKYPQLPVLRGMEPEHEDQLHRNKGSADDHYHFKFEHGNKEQLKEFLPDVMSNCLMTTSNEESLSNFLAALDTFMGQDQHLICFDNGDTAQKNTEPDRLTSYSD